MMVAEPSPEKEPTMFRVSFATFVPSISKVRIHALMRLIDDKVYGFKFSFIRCGGAVGVVRLVSNSHHCGDGVGFLTLGDVHTDAVNGETQTSLRLIVH